MWLHTPLAFTLWMAVSQQLPGKIPLLCILCEDAKVSHVVHRLRHEAVCYLQRGLRPICSSWVLQKPAALSRQAAHCWDRRLCLAVSPWESFPLRCWLVLLLKSCSGISLISYATVSIKKAARKLGNRFLGVKDQTGKQSNSKEKSCLTPGRYML